MYKFWRQYCTNVIWNYRNITANNWFTNICLIKNLKRNKKLIYIGTIRTNKRELPQQFLPIRNREIQSLTIGLQGDFTLVTYYLKTNKAVSVVSSTYNDDAIYVEDHANNTRYVYNY